MPPAPGSLRPICWVLVHLGWPSLRKLRHPRSDTFLSVAFLLFSKSGENVGTLGTGRNLKLAEGAATLSPLLSTEKNYRRLEGPP